MSMRPRFEIVGIWSGPTNPAGDFTRDCHREVTRDRSLILFLKGVHGIRFTDGTMLYLSARQMDKGERAKKPINGYTTLIRDCARYGVSSVDALIAAQEMAKQITGAKS